MPAKRRMPDQRRFTRIPFTADTRLSSAAGNWDTALLDVSLKGALISRPPAWLGAVGDDCRLDIALAGSDVAIHMQVTVAHIEPHELGLTCAHIDLDSVGHLRRLIELNLGDARQLDRELRALGQRS